MKPETSALLGQQVGNIRVVDLLGEGGMGAVYVGFDDKLQRKVALKAIRSEYRFQEEAKARFLREARILSQLDHPHICTVHDFLVLELVEGKSLREAMKDDLDHATKMSIAKQLLEALAMRRRLLGDEDPDVATSLNNLAKLLKEKGDLEAAEPLHRQALAMKRRLLGSGQRQRSGWIEQGLIPTAPPSITLGFRRTSPRIQGEGS